jgi:hypothetical protein
MAGTKKIHGLVFEDHSRPAPKKTTKKVSRGKAKKK